MQLLMTIGLFALLFFNTNKISAQSCAFCKQEVIENQSVLEGEYFSVLYDHRPRMKGHLMAIPKRHVEKAHELSKEEWGELSVIIPKVVKVFSEFLHTDQYIILEKNGPNPFQHVPHVHFHLFPAISQSRSEIFDIITTQLSREELEAEVALFRFYFAS